MALTHRLARGCPPALVHSKVGRCAVGRASAMVGAVWFSKEQAMLEVSCPLCQRSLGMFAVPTQGTKRQSVKCSKCGATVSVVVGADGIRADASFGSR